MKTCGYCGTQFDGKNKVFCSKKCSSLHRALANHREGKINKVRSFQRCAQCGVEYPRHDRGQKFCSSQCYGQFKVGKRTGGHSPETIKKITETHRKKWEHIPTKMCQVCGKPVRRLARRIYCSNPCSAKAKWQNEKHRRSMMDGMAKNHFGWSTRKKGRESFPERFWRQRLERHSAAKFEQEYVVNKALIGAPGRGNYFLDFFFSDYNIDLEIDGRQHEERIESDTIRDRALTAAGIRVVRYRWPKGKTRFEEGHKQAMEFIAVLQSLPAKPHDDPTHGSREHKKFAQQ